MANVLVFDPSGTVPNRVTLFKRSENTPDYDGEENKLLNPNVAALSGVPTKYWKVDNEDVVEMSQEEKDSIEDELNANKVMEKKYQVLEYGTFGRLMKDTWYYQDDGDGQYSRKVEETTYEYAIMKLKKKTVKTFSYNGTEVSSQEWDYYTDGDKKIMKLFGS